MPNRLLRDWTDSEKVHKLTAEAERFFLRLIMKADDYGRYFANIKLLKASLFPLYEKLKDEKVEAWLNECQGNDLIHVYEVGTKRYLEIKSFDQKLKVRRSKYPPSNDQDRLELQSGYVYIIGTDYASPVKIGFSVNPWSRLKEITINHPDKLELLMTIKGEKSFESALHRELKNLRVKNEWFLLNSDIIDCLLRYSKEEITRDNMFVEIRSYSSQLRRHPESEVEEEVEVEVEVEVEEKGNAHARERILGVFNAEEEILKNQIRFEQIVMNAGREVSQGREILHSFHLYLESKDQYPKTKKSVFAGFEKWINDEKKFERNGTGTHQRNNSNGSEKLGTSEARIDKASKWGS